MAAGSRQQVVRQLDHASRLMNTVMCSTGIGGIDIYGLEEITKKPPIKEVY